MHVKTPATVSTQSQVAVTSMDDQRLVWMGERVRLALGLRVGLFEELVSRDGGRLGRDLQAHLDRSGAGYQPAMIFYQAEVEVEEEREVEGEQLINQMVEQAEQLEGEIALARRVRVGRAASLEPSYICTGVDTASSSSQDSDGNGSAEAKTVKKVG